MSTNKVTLFCLVVILMNGLMSLVNAQRNFFVKTKFESIVISNVGIRDSFRILFPGNWSEMTTPVLYQTSGGGYVLGTNEYDDRAKGQVFLNDSAIVLHGAYFWLGALEGNEGLLNFDVYDFNVFPGSRLVRKSVELQVLKTGFDAQEPVYVEFDEPVKLESDFVLAIGLDDAGTANVGLVSSTHGEAGLTGLSWEQWADSYWHTIFSAWNLDIDVAIFPVVSAVDNQGGNDIFDGGDGTMDNPYQISTAEQLDKIRLFPSSFFTLLNDINIPKDFYSPERGWLPLHHVGNCFEGGLDGQGFTIAGISIARPAMNYIGLFSCIENAVIKNVNIHFEKISGHHNVGGLTGVAKNSTILNVACSGHIEGSENAGGIAGLVDGGELKLCHSVCNVYGYRSAGGLVGSISGQTEINRCYSMGHVEGEQFVGGLIGQIEKNVPQIKSGFGGVTLEIPKNNTEDVSLISWEEGDVADVLREGEKSVSPVIKIKLAGDVDDFSGFKNGNAGFPVYRLSFPLYHDSLNEQKLRVRVRFNEEARFPLFGYYDQERKMYSVDLYGFSREWVLGVVEGEPVSFLSGGIYTENANIENNENTAMANGFKIVDESGKLNRAGLQNVILPVANELIQKYNEAGFGEPKLIPDAIENKWMIHLIDKDIPEHNSVPFSSYYLSPREVNKLGGIYIFYPSENIIKDVSNPASWKIRDVLAHEMFHAIQFGYDYCVNNELVNGASVSSARFIEESMACIMGPTYVDFNSFILNKFSISKTEGNHPLGQGLDHYRWTPYPRQDFIAYLSRRYFNSKLTFLDEFLKDIALEAPSEVTAQNGALLMLYRKGIDRYFRKRGLSFSYAYFDYFFQRAYLHDPSFLLTNDEQSDGQFARKSIHKGLFGVPDHNLYFKDWKSGNTKELQYTLLEFNDISANSGRCVLFHFPEEITEKPDTIRFSISASGDHRFSSSIDAEGLKIAYVRAVNENGKPFMDEMPVIIDDISKPVLIPVEEDMTHVVFFVIYPSLKESDINVSFSLQGKGKVYNLTQDKGYETIQAAVSEARDNDQIVVSAGTYNESVQFQDKTILLFSLDGAENTIIDGNGVVLKSGITINAIKNNESKIFGFTFQNWEYAIGMYNIGTQPGNIEIGNNVFRKNSTAISIHKLKAHVHNNVFKENENKDETLIYLGASTSLFEFNSFENNRSEHVMSISGSPVVKENRFFNNISESYAAAIVVNSGQPDIIKNIFEKNMAAQAGAIQVFGGQTKIIENLFRDNSSIYNGGAMVVNGLSSTENITSQIELNTFINNTTGEDGGGGAIDCFWCKGSIKNNIFENNQAREGGAIYFHESSVTITGNTFKNNHATSFGGAISGYNIGGWEKFAKIIDDTGFERTVYRHKPCFDEPTNTYMGNTHAENFGAWGPGINNWCPSAGYDILIR